MRSILSLRQLGRQRTCDDEAQRVRGIAIYNESDGLATVEIDNPKLVSSGDTGTLSWIKDAKEPVYSEFRDDRFSAAFERNPKDPVVFAVAYVVRAVSPGRYVLPQAYVEDMYRPDRFGRTATGTIEIAPK